MSSLLTVARQARSCCSMHGTGEAEPASNLVRHEHLRCARATAEVGTMDNTSTSNTRVSKANVYMKRVGCDGFGKRRHT